MRNATDDESLRRDVDYIYDEYRTFEPVPSVVYHYTSLQAMIDIFSSGLIRCSNVQYSNDPAEVTYGYNLVRDVVATRFRGTTFEALFKSIAKMDYYAVSFSAAADALPQWRAYCANGRGVAIGFASDLFARHDELVFGRVEYDRRRQEQFVARVLDVYEPRITNARNDLDAFGRYIAEIGEVLLIIAGLLKDETYASENEYRAFVTQPRLRLLHTYPVKFRATLNSVVPYLEFPYSMQDVAQPIRTIAIGPCLDPAITAPSIEAFVEQIFPVPPIVRQSLVKMRA